MRNLLASLTVIITIAVVSFLIWKKKTRRVSYIEAYGDAYWDILKERRSSIRFNEKLAVTCSLVKKDSDTYHVHAKDISGTGICLQVPEILPEGATLNLSIKLPDGGSLEVSGTVVWVNEQSQETRNVGRIFNAGVQFSEIKPKDKGRFEKFITTNIREQGNKNKEG